MNEERRTTIGKAISLLEEAKDLLDPCASDEREIFDNLSEKEQESDKGIALDSAASHLEDSLDTIDTLITKLEDARV